MNSFLLKYGINNTHYDLDKLVNNKDSGVRYSIALHPDLNQHHIDKLVDDKDVHVRASIARHPKFNGRNV